MAVPAHDERDFEFAQQFALPTPRVIAGPAADEKLPYTGDGTLINSPGYDGLTWPEAKKKITIDLAARGVGKATVNYKLRDWLFSRQRYWGEPFPIVWISEADYRKAVFEMLPELKYLDGSDRNEKEKDDDDDDDDEDDEEDEGDDDLLSSEGVDGEEDFDDGEDGEDDGEDGEGDLGEDGAEGDEGGDAGEDDGEDGEEDFEDGEEGVPEGDEEDEEEEDEDEEVPAAQTSKRQRR
jgi:hypothetical protein